jgi:hypothetical protein
VAFLGRKPKGTLADPVFRRERARKAGLASHTPDAEVTRTLKRVARLTPEQVAGNPELLAQVQALLPEGSDGTGGRDGPT